MSQLLDALAGVPNACEPIPGIVTGGQPGPEHLAALRRAGCQVVVDIREAMEPRPFAVPDAPLAAGLEYRHIHVGAALLPYFLLEQGMEETEAVALAMRMGLRSAGLLEQALEYARSRQGI